MNPAAALQACEEALLHEDWRNRKSDLERMLAPDFVEIAANGKTATRTEVLNWLLQKDPLARWRFADWQLEPLTPQLALLRYRAQQSEPRPSAGQGAWHSSLWAFSDEAACWQLRFHQASKIL